MAGMQRVLNFIRKQKGYDPDQWYRGGLSLLSSLDVNERIKTALLKPEPYMVARFGSVEIKPTLYYSLLKNKSFVDKIRLYLKGDIDYVLDSTRYEQYMSYIMCVSAGFFPRNPSLLPAFSQLMVDDAAQIDLCGCWLNEKLLIPFFSPGVEFCELGALEPYDYASPWTIVLEGKKVLVIHPFEKSIISQYKRRDKLWENLAILPEFELKTIKAVQSLACENSIFSDWFQALDFMKGQIDVTDFDVALIGCGAYGLPLAAHVKRLGKKAIHLGGPLQILFGIKGARWDNIPSVSKFYNKYWVRPLESDVIKNNHLVENGCYW